MQSLVVSLNAVLPTCLLLVIGYGIKRFQVVDKSFFAQANSLTFSLFLPVMLFHNIYQNDLGSLFQGKAILFAVGSLAALFVLLWFTVPRLVKNPEQRGVVMQGVFRSNYAIFGVSIITSIYGKDYVGLASILSAILVPTYNIMAVIVLAVFTSDKKVSPKQILKSVVTNPLIIACLLGIAASFSGIGFPQFLENTIGQVAALATPMALLVLGGDFEFSSLKGKFRTALTVSLIKLIAVPVAMVPVAVWLGFRGSDLMALVLAWASPVAVSSYIMAQQAKADHALAGQIIMFSSVLCVLTIFGWVYLLSCLGLL